MLLMETIHPFTSISRTSSAIPPIIAHPLLHENRATAYCSTCRLGSLCLLGDIGNQAAKNNHPIHQLVLTRRDIKRGERLYSPNTRFTSLYAIRRGFFKTSLFTASGNEQILGFPMAGEILGFDGIETERHTLTATAIEDSEICIIPFAHLQDVSEQLPNLLHQLHKVMSREIVRDQSIMLLLGSMRAEERVATFLLNLSQRFVALGFSAYKFHLRMTREEIGSYLGLKLETVSRVFSRLQKLGLLAIQQKQVRILDIEKLGQVGKILTTA
jgi:CRP/FNR family transcriptional regulator, anaerobic regulatory protein